MRSGGETPKIQGQGQAVQGGGVSPWIQGLIDRINAAPVDTNFEAEFGHLVDELARQIPDKAQLKNVLDQIEQGIDDVLLMDTFSRVSQAKLEQIATASEETDELKDVAGPGEDAPVEKPFKKPGAKGVRGAAPAGAEGAPRPQGSTPESQGHLYDILDEQRGIGSEMQAVRNDQEAAAEKKAEAGQAQHAAEGEQRTYNSYFEQAKQGLDATKRQISDGWGQLKLFKDEIAKKADYARFMRGQAAHEAQRWYMNWLWISLGNIRSNEGKILLRWLALCQQIAWAGQGRVNAPPLELGSLDNITQPPDGSYRAALNAEKELEGMQAKYANEANRLREKENTDIPKDEQRVAEYRRKAEENGKEASFQRGLSEEAQQVLAMKKAQAQELRKKYDILDQDKNKAMRAAGKDPPTG